MTFHMKGFTHLLLDVHWTVNILAEGNTFWVIYGSHDITFQLLHVITFTFMNTNNLLSMALPPA